MLDNFQYKLFRSKWNIIEDINRPRPNSPALFISLISSSLSNRYRERSAKRLYTVLSRRFFLFFFFHSSLLRAHLSMDCHGTKSMRITIRIDKRATRPSVYSFLPFFFPSFFISSMKFMVERAVNKWPSTTLGQNWQANTSQRMQISRTICQSSHWAYRGPDRRGHFNRQSFTIRPSSGASEYRIAHSPLCPSSSDASAPEYIPLTVSLSLPTRVFL